MEKVLEFARSPKFSKSLLIATITSQPRWRYARALGSEFNAESGVGAPRAIKGLLKTTRSIIEGKDEFAEFFLNREDDHSDIRTEIWAAFVDVLSI